ncbi:GDP-L-fucose synthase [Acidimicrobiia bacterium]|nr:GDP-L-fucose synthase [Acidimicrobiia bacterium]
MFGSKGLVGSSVVRRFQNSDIITEVVQSSRKDTDLFSLADTSKTIEAVNPDIIINAAAKVGGILANNTYRTEFIIENLKINLNILESCIGNNTIKIINLGSSCIYPLNADNPISEDSFMKGELEPTNSPYAMAKISAIEIGRSMNKQYGHQIVNLMPTNLYGPNDNFSENESHVIPGIMHKMHTAKINNDSIFKIWGSGKPLREFLYVDDLSSAIEYLLVNNINTDLLNVGSGEEISILDLANKIKDVIGYEGSIELDHDKPDGNPRKLLDSSKINELGWKSEISLVDGLKKTYSWYLENIL